MKQSLVVNNYNGKENSNKSYFGNMGGKVLVIDLWYPLATSRVL